MIDWAAFFPTGTRVLALPGWRNPRIFLPAGGFQEGWRKSALYPASRLSARLYRLWQRFKAASKLSSVREARSDGWPVGAFVDATIPSVTSVVVLAGTSGPAQKVTVQLWSEQGEILGYLKYGEKPAARDRLAHEYEMLSGLPDGVGPKPLKFGPMDAGTALALSPISGNHLKATLPPPNSVLSILDSLVVAGPIAIRSHPWIQALSPTIKAEAKPILAALEGQGWPVVIQHGDFAPWNILQDSGQGLRALDWEYGSLQGFPYLDFAFYILQVAMLIHRWPPERARDYAVEQLTRTPWPALNQPEAFAIVQLAALDAYGKAVEDGHSDSAHSQMWRRQLWLQESLAT